MIDNTYSKALTSVIRLLSIRDRSKNELEVYLTQKKYSSKIIELVLEFCVKHQLISDQKFAINWLQSQLKRGKGEVFISQSLKQKGISSTDINQAFSQINPCDYFPQIELLLTKNAAKWHSLPKNYQILAQKKLLYSRGFSSRVIDAFMKREIQ